MIYQGDIKLRPSTVMADVPEGGGGPSGSVINDGASNEIFTDVTSSARAGGQVSIRQLHLSVDTPDTDALLDASVIVSQIPNDPNVSVTLTQCGFFDRRTAIANAIENYLIQGPEWPGFLLENHVKGQRSMQIFGRVGGPEPEVGRTLVLVYDEGLPSERRQYVRVTKTDSETRTFSYSASGGFVDYQAQVVTCELSDALREPYPGSPPDRGYARNAAKTVIRDTTAADAATYYGASTLTHAAQLGDSAVKVASIYTQLVPSARTEVGALDQRPAAQRQITLATAPRKVEVGVSAHTTRIKVTAASRGYNFVRTLTPLPAPGTIIVSYLVFGKWYTVFDDGAGAFSGSGVGQAIYTTGSILVTLQALPDVGSSVIIQWGESVGYTNRTGQAGFRLPEYDMLLEKGQIKPGTLVYSWISGGVIKTATDDGNGGFTGDATGLIQYAGGRVNLRPVAMLDPGGQFNIAYEYASTVTKSVSPTVDAAGFANIVLDDVPSQGTVAVRWLTARKVSATSGATSGVVIDKKSTANSYVPFASVTYLTKTPPAGTGIAVYEPSTYVPDPEAVPTPGVAAWLASEKSTITI